MAEAGADHALRRRQLVPFAALSASYFAHIGFFNPYLPLWLKDLGLDLFTISLLTSAQALTRLLPTQQRPTHRNFFSSKNTSGLSSLRGNRPFVFLARGLLIHV